MEAPGQQGWCWPCLDLTDISFLCNMGNLHRLLRLLPNGQDASAAPHLLSQGGLSEVKTATKGSDPRIQE